MGFTSYPFTWKRGSRAHGGVEERLDKALASTDWTQFPQSSSPTPSFILSDHAPLLIFWISTLNSFSKSKIFKFEKWWTQLSIFKM